MPAIADRPPAIVRPTLTAASSESKSLYNQRLHILEGEKILASRYVLDGNVLPPSEGWIHAEADTAAPRTLENLASARRQFLASVQRSHVEAELPPVLLSEG